MPVIRATAATALPTIRQLATDLARWVRDSAPLAAAPQLLAQVEGLAQDALARSLQVEVRVPQGFVPDVAFWAMLGADSSEDPSAGSSLRLQSDRAAQVTLVDHTDPPGTRAGTLVAPILVWMAAAGDDQTRLLADAAVDRPLVVITGAADQIEPLRRAARDHAWGVTAGTGGHSLAQRLNEAPFLEALDVLRAASIAQALESLAAVFHLAHDAEMRGLRARRSLLQQRAAQLPGTSSAGRAASDVLSDVRARAQRQFSEFSRGTDDRWAALTSQSGPIWAALEARLASLTLAERPRTKALATSIPADFLEDWTSHLRDTLARNAQSDVVAMGDLFRTLTEEIVQCVSRDGGPAVVVTFQHLERTRLDRVADEALASSRPYQGELPRPGMFEYLMIARRYQIILFMFMSAFGLSFLRTYREFMIPVGVVLLALGGFNVYNSVRRERHEGRRREREKAREQLRTDARRVLADVQRAWLSSVSQHLSDQVPLVASQIDATIRDFAARASDEAGAERHRVQRQLQGFETAERRLATSARGRETTAGAIAQLRGELRLLLASTLRPWLGT